MAYNPYNAVNSIYRLKGEWETANKANDEEKKKAIADKAQAYYNQLRDNDYGTVADSLNKSDYTAAKKIRDNWANWAKADKTATRPYLYSLGKKYNMSQADVDKIIGWNNDTGQVSIGGKVIGTPDSVVDGVSYWSDTSVLDNAFDDYAKRIGLTVDNGVSNPAYSQRMSSAETKNDQYWDAIGKDRADVQGKYDSIFGYANQDVTQTDEYKSAFENIMPGYNLKAMQGRNNVIASGGGSNGGNIDSFSAANGMRQQAAITAQGQQLAHQMGMDAYGARIDKVRGILSDLGVYNQNTYDAMNKSIQNDVGVAQTYFDNAETAKKNDTAISSEEAAVTGYAPNKWILKNDPFYKQFVDENGNLKQQYMNFDFQAAINDAKKNNDTETANKLAVLRGMKIGQDFSKYGKYIGEGDIKYFEAPRTADFYLNNKGIDADLQISSDNLEGVKHTNNTQLQMTKDTNATEEGIRKYEADVGSNTSKYIADQERGAGKDAIDAYINYGYGVDDKSNGKDVEVVTDFDSAAANIRASAKTSYDGGANAERRAKAVEALGAAAGEGQVLSKTDTINTLIKNSRNPQTSIGLRGLMTILIELGFSDTEISKLLKNVDEETYTGSDGKTYYGLIIKSEQD